MIAEVKPDLFEAWCEENYVPCDHTFTNALSNVDNPFNQLMHIDELLRPRANIYGYKNILAYKFSFGTWECLQYSDVVPPYRIYWIAIIKCAIFVYSSNINVYTLCHRVSTKYTVIVSSDRYPVRGVS